MEAIPHNPFDAGYYEGNELRRCGFAEVGENVRIARNCTIIGLPNISIGNHVRIDPYTTIIATGFLKLGSYIHIGSGCHLCAVAGITLGDFSGLSQGVRLYSATDDYSGQGLTNPMVPARFLNVKRGAVVLGKHAIIGAGTVVLPGCVIGEGSSVGALSLVTKSLDPWGVYFGTPAKRLKARSRRLLELEARLREETTHLRGLEHTRPQSVIAERR